MLGDGKGAKACEVSEEEHEENVKLTHSCVSTQMHARKKIPTHNLTNPPTTHVRSKHTHTHTHTHAQEEVCPVQHKPSVGVFVPVCDKSLMRITQVFGRAFYRVRWATHA